MIDPLRQNISTEIKMLMEMAEYGQRARYSSDNEKKLLIQAIDALESGIKILNENTSALLANLPIAQELPSISKQKNSLLKEVIIQRGESEERVVLYEKDREKFLQELSITEQIIKKIKRRPAINVEKIEEFKAARGYIKMSNKFFLSTASQLISRGYFKPLPLELRRANLNILFPAYVATTLFTTLLSLFFALILSVILLFFDMSFVYPFVKFSELNITRVVVVSLVPIIMPLMVFLALYYYPSTEKKSIAKKIDQELPFAVIHMSAIAGSGIEPSQIFRIIELSREYPYLRKEIRKVLNQINLYGYDLVNALNAVTTSTPSTKLSELFSGLSTTITSGGNLADFFAKRAETLLISYRLEREKYTKLAETFMDIYIGIVIAAPMILMIILVIISVAQLNTGLAPMQMTLLIILIVGILNMLFIGFLHIKQPVY